jgi:SAM-dependent methyltransferase
MSRLEETYRAHHESGARSGFTFGGRERVALLVEWIGRGRRVLDLGCRDGALTANLMEGNSVVGADIDGEALRRGRADGRLGKTIQLDMTVPLPFSNEAFDAVFGGEVLEHQPFPEWVTREVVRILAPGGLFVGSVPNAYRLKNRLRFLLGLPFDEDPTHLRFFSSKSLRRLLSVRFEAVEIRPIIGRLAAVQPDLFANSLVWRCRKRNR